MHVKVIICFFPCQLPTMAFALSVTASSLAMTTREDIIQKRQVSTLPSWQRMYDHINPSECWLTCMSFRHSEFTIDHQQNSIQCLITDTSRVLYVLRIYFSASGTANRIALESLGMVRYQDDFTITRWSHHSTTIGGTSNSYSAFLQWSHISWLRTSRFNAD